MGKLSSKSKHSKIPSVCPFNEVHIPVLNFNNKIFLLDSGSEDNHNININQANINKDLATRNTESQETPKDPENQSL